MPAPTSIVDVIASPSIGLLNPVLDTSGPFGAGSHVFTTFTTGGAMLLPAGTYQVHGTYGVIVVPNGAIPVTWGHTTQFDGGGPLDPVGDRYDNALCQVVPEHQILSGFYLPIDRVEVHYVPEVIFWPFRLVGGDQLGLWVSPDITVDLFYLCVL
jgi:hypothetical protein